jgi:hypothetical protein
MRTMNDEGRDDEDDDNEEEDNGQRTQ